MDFFIRHTKNKFDVLDPYASWSFWCNRESVFQTSTTCEAKDISVEKLPDSRTLVEAYLRTARVPVIWNWVLKSTPSAIWRAQPGRERHPLKSGKNPRVKLSDWTLCNSTRNSNLSPSPHLSPSALLLIVYRLCDGLVT